MSKVFLISILFLLIIKLRARPRSTISPLEHSTPQSKNFATSISRPDQTNRTKTRILTQRGQYSGELNEQTIVFPDQIIFEPIPKIDGSPKCADESTFCEDFNSYPYYHVKEFLQRNPYQNDLFGMDDTIDNININNRVGEDEETFVCSSLNKIIFPQIGKNKNNKWKYIINQGDQDGYVQGVRTEMCVRKNVPCDIIGNLPNGYTTSCKQKYFYRRMMSLTDSGEPAPDTFQLPSACCCTYRKNVDFLARFGSQTSPIRIKK